jgi:hemerythrin superfamily protein
MDAIELLTHQHRIIEAAFEALVASQDQRAERFPDAADELMAHITVEEEHFYPTVKAKNTSDILLESLEEHLSLKRIVADLTALATTDEHFEPKLRVLKEQLEHHHGEEEEGLFPKVRGLLSTSELEELGERMLAAEEALLAGKPRAFAKDQTRAARPLA